jgi:hypothetical protein
MEQIPIGGPAPDNVVPLRPPQPEAPSEVDEERPETGVDQPPVAGRDASTGVPEPQAAPVDETAEVEPPTAAEPSQPAPEPREPVAEEARATETEEDEEELSWEEVVARDAEAAADAEVEEGPPPNAELTLMLEQIARVGLGLTVGVVDAVAGSLRRTADEQPAPDEPRNEPVEVLTGAALGAAATLAELMAKAVGAASDAVEPIASVAANPPLMGGLSRGAGSALRFLDGTWKAKEADARSSAEAFMHDLVPQVTAGALEQIDLTALVRERLDINAVAQDIDLDALIARVDIDAIVDRVDMEALVAKLPIDAVLDRVDLNAVADRLDVNRVAERLDIEAVIGRIDLAGLAQEVIDEIDLPGIIRDSSGAMASETVQDVRVVGIGADRFVAKVVDRILRREHDRDTAVPGMGGEDR